MALFDDLAAEIYGLTKRPDLVSETATAIKAATLKAHQLGYWDRDLFESGVSFPYPAMLQELDYSALFPRWRAAKYFRKHDGITLPGGEGDFFSIISPDGIFDRDQIQKDNVVYLAGENFKFRSYTAFQYLLMGCYLNPILVPANYDSWIAKQHPYAVIFGAVSQIYKGIGSDQEAAHYSGLRDQQYESIIISNTVAVGY